MKHKVKNLFVLSYGNTLLIINDHAHLPKDIRGEWQIWKNHNLYCTISIIAENIPLPRTTNDRVLETKTLLNKADLDPEKYLVELSVVEG